MTEAEATKTTDPGARAKPKGAVVGVVLPALLAGAASFGGAKLGGSHAQAAPTIAAEPAAKPPGPTVALEPFIVSPPDANGKLHAVKVTLAVELRHGAKEDQLKGFVPRVRDATLTFLRTRTFEELTDHAAVDAMRSELLARFTKLGLSAAEQVLITDFVTQ